MKNKSTDAKKVALSQSYEIYFISGYYKIPLADVRAARKKVGVSRKKIYAELRLMGYTIKTKSIK